MAVTPGRTDRVLIVHPEPAVRQEVESVLRRVHRHSIAVRQATDAGTAIRIGREYDPSIIFLDLTRERALALSLARELRRPDRLLIGLFNPLLGGDDRASEGELFREAVRAGVGDFVPLPLSAEELAAALVAKPEAAASIQEGRAVAFFSHQGGVGTTTLAVNTALALRNGEGSRSVALLDANVQFGCAAAHLGLVPERDLGDAIAELEVGTMFPLPTAAPLSDIAVLASPLDPRTAQRITPEGLSRLLIELRRRYQMVVIDTAPVLDLLTLSVLDLSETVVVVTEGTAPTIAGTARLLRMLETLGFGEERVQLALNRHRSVADVLPPDLIAGQLGRAVDHLVPFLLPVAVGTHRGVPALLDRGAARFAESIRRLAQDVGRAGAAPGRAS
jgi:Flp pilus assembly CpaE family ATPase